MKQPQLSPKKYIETKVRSLPLHKCYVNFDWAEGKMADVFVMRKHPNGNLTIGVYLVDLLCLGIKDTFFMFNYTEEEMKEKLFKKSPFMFKEIDYTTAHNIVYAGRDYALDYDIHPHKDFATTKFILEEDTDKIPLMDIEVGDKDGNPILWVHEANQYLDVYAKLMKNLGKDNFTYFIGASSPAMLSHLLDQEDEENEDENDQTDYSEYEDLDTDGDDGEANSARIEDYEINTIDYINASFITGEDLINEQLISTRTPQEQSVLALELMIRLYLKVPYLPGTPDIYESNDFALALAAQDAEDWVPENLDMEAVQFVDQLTVLTKRYESLISKVENEKDLLDLEVAINTEHIELIKGYTENPLVLFMLFETAFFNSQLKPVVDFLVEHLEAKAGRYPFLGVTLATASLIDEDFNYNQQFAYLGTCNDLKEAYPNNDKINEEEASAFFAFKLWQAIQEIDLSKAIYYYRLSIAMDAPNEFVSEVVSPLLNLLHDMLDKHEYLINNYLEKERERHL